jgi:hypothetical protein
MRALVKAVTIIVNPRDSVRVWEFLFYLSLLLTMLNGITIITIIIIMSVPQSEGGHTYRYTLQLVNRVSKEGHRFGTC